jgi:hypothetical protein
MASIRTGKNLAVFPICLSQTIDGPEQTDHRMGEMRSKADHGKFSEITHAEAAAMLKGVRT